MFWKNAALAMLAALALLSTGQSYAGQSSAGVLSEHPPFVHRISCRSGFFNNCFGPDRDLLVDRLYRYSCSEAREILLDRGFSRVKTVSCNGANFRFSARWKGKIYALRVSRSTGDIVSMKRVN
jgi:hypothetical protein